jgi:hypothetical protein
VAAGIAFGVGVHANEPDDFACDPGFFAKFPQGRLFYGFSHVYNAAWQGFGALEGLFGARVQSQTAGAVKHHAIDGQQGRLRSHSQIPLSSVERSECKRLARSLLQFVAA